jgi:hypothetical protein
VAQPDSDLGQQAKETPMAKPGKTPAKSANRSENAVQSAITSSYNTFIPLKDACGVYVKHPMNSRTIRVSTYTTEFLDIYRELVDLGMGERLSRELREFSDLYGSGWARVQEWVDRELSSDQDAGTAE